MLAICLNICSEYIYVLLSHQIALIEPAHFTKLIYENYVRFFAVNSSYTSIVI